MYYLDVNFYRYFIGRDDQSVNEKVMTGRIDQQIKITKIMINAYDSMEIPNKKLKSYMLQYLSIMMIVSSALLINEGSATNIAKRDALWDYLKTTNPAAYKTISLQKLGLPLQFKTKFGKSIVVKGYHLFNRIYGFN